MSQTLNLKKVSFAYHEREMLTDASATIYPGDRVLVVGSNGAGKSTFMKLCLGELTPDRGSIERPRALLLYVSQEFPKDEITVNEYIEKNVPQKHLKKASDFRTDLGFPKNYEDKLVTELSGGQQKILALSSALAQNPAFLFLDEPENHLDIVSRTKLIEILYEFRGALVMVSHDRRTVDTLAQKVFEIDRGHLSISEGGYEEYLEYKMSRVAGMQRDYDSRAKKIEQLEKSVRIMGKIAFRGGGVANYQNRKRELEAVKAEHGSEARAEVKSTKIGLAIKTENYHSGKLIVKINDASFSYPGHTKPMFSGVNLELRAGQKVVLLGRNGSGKSTFLNGLTGHLPLATGNVVWGNDVSWSLFNQHAEFTDTMRAVDVVSDVLKFRDDEARRVLGMVKFTGEQMITQVGELSGGERMRLRFALAFGNKPDFLVLDEPTNHLDETTWEILCDVCKQFTGTLLVVSHDYAFIEELNPNFYWMLANKKVVERHKDLDALVAELSE
jgi:ATPase subunit of ABC transporter with duplicated ATPase domains